MVEILFLIPFIAGIIAFILPQAAGRYLLATTGAVHLLLALLLWSSRPEALLPNYFAVTPEGLLSLLVISMVFFLISVYTIAYLKESAIQSEKIFTGSHQEIAHSLNSSREVISRLLKQMENKGMIKLSRNRVDFSNLL